ncbi:helix-turn-helix domain-containing protein [Edaphobacter modestus]|uniref:Helix-turn-helix protein n=1 Tax=Edaphobacter modestus TaxID=388466 RepID=A0A4Q7YPE5_9BACT|nr:helix-turn-helix domain-containing protein [Edaphobacter modestus]RZU38743.1 helix-turn-helix protein [Edaphobacter modestus]
MSIQVSSMVWSNGPQILKERMALLAIADHANDSGSALPGIELIAQKSCMDKRSIMRWLKVLEANGWMSIER